MLFIALLGGIMPALFWLWFWLREDRRRPEPRGRLAFTFFLGMTGVFIVIPIEQYLQGILGPTLSPDLLLFWSLTEELTKFVLAFFAALHTRDMNEPIDGVIYMITVALGFAALENTLFILGPLEDGLLIEGLAVGNMRFIGATLLHTIASGVVGLFIAFSYYRSSRIKKRFVFVGIACATVLHALFNFFIIDRTDNSIWVVFALVWLAVVGLILMFEKVKRIQPLRN